ncbi:MAG: hypothetical protein V5B40_04925 [Candidatus Accumulibacter meliphilus]
MPTRTPPLWEMLDAAMDEPESQPHPVSKYEFDQRIARQVLGT